MNATCQYRKKEKCLLKNNLGLDISIPDINGLAVLSEIKKLKRTSRFYPEYEVTKDPKCSAL